MLVLAIIMGVGFVAGRQRVLERSTMQQMSTMITYVFNPMMMVSSAVSSLGSIDKDALYLLFGIVVGIYLVLMVLGWLVAPLFDRTPGQRELYQLMFMFGNVGFMGIPVVRGVFGEACVVYVLAFVVGFNLFFYTYGVALMSGGVLNAQTLKSALNPGTICSLATLLLVIFEPPVPDFLATTAEYLGDLASPLAMLAVGVTIANADLKAIFTDRKVYLFTLVKMILIPLIALPLLKMTPFSREVIGVCLVEIGMPVANLVLIIGTEKKLDCANVSAAIIMTTLLSVITVPILVSLI